MPAANRSTNNGGAYVEVAGLPHAVAVRDSKDPDGPKLAFRRDFVATLRPLH